MQHIIDVTKCSKKGMTQILAKNQPKTINTHKQKTKHRSQVPNPCERTQKKQKRQKKTQAEEGKPTGICKHQEEGGEINKFVGKTQ